jgi:hypothetical protein
MKNTQFAPLILSIIAFWTLTITEAISSESCPISRSIYRDGNGGGFQLIFSSPPPRSVISAIATIQHPQQGEIYRFNVTQSSGYGSIWLSEDNAKESDRSLWISFFDNNLKSATPLFFGEEKQSPKYAIIAELGSYDYYNRRSSNAQNILLLRDAIWIYDRCQ